MEKSLEIFFMIQCMKKIVIILHKNLEKCLNIIPPTQSHLQVFSMSGKLKKRLIWTCKNGSTYFDHFFYAHPQLKKNL